MRQIRKISVTLLFAIIVMVSIASPASTQQTSLDSRIFKAFERIDGRTNLHEQDAAAIRARLDLLSPSIEDLRTKLTALPTDGGNQDARRDRRNLHGRLINLSAEYLSQSFKLVDSAAAVISANLSDLAKLATEMRNSGDAASSAQKLQKRIQSSIAAGRSMRSALVQLRNWTRLDPSMAGRFQSLRRIMGALDRRISIDRVRLESRQISATGAVRNRRLDALDRTVDRLGDMYAEVAAEKEALKDLRDELAIAIQLGRLEITQEVAARAIPRMNGVNAPTTGVTSLKDMATVIVDLNNSLIVEARAPDTTTATPTKYGKPSGMDISGFSNF
jgi:prefoldin subunit 5